MLAANLLLLGVAYVDRSWGALGIAMMIGPITNGVLAVVGLACLPVLKRRAPGAATGTYLLASLVLPLLAIPTDLFAIIAMDLRGC